MYFGCLFIISHQYVLPTIFQILNNKPFSSSFIQATIMIPYYIIVSHSIKGNYHLCEDKPSMCSRLKLFLSKENNNDTLLSLTKVHLKQEFDGPIQIMRLVENLGTVQNSLFTRLEGLRDQRKLNG